MKRGRQPITNSDGVKGIHLAPKVGVSPDRLPEPVALFDLSPAAPVALSVTTPTTTRPSRVVALIAQARREPIGVDVSDWSDEWVAGFLAGQASILEELEREPERYGVGLTSD